MMIRAYLDEGGTHDQAPVIVMAGFLSSDKRWRRFEKQWNKVLNPDGGSRVFHATDCLGQEGHGDFRGWAKADRDALANALIPIVKERTFTSLSCAFSLQDYREAVPAWIRQKWKNPYYVCLFTILNVIYVNRDRLHLRQQEKISFVFAHKPKYVGLLRELYDELKCRGNLFKTLLGARTEGTPRADVPIQAADLLCYIVRTFYEKDYFEQDSAHPRTIDLARRLGLENHLTPDFLDRDALAMFARSYAETHKQVGAWEWNSAVRIKSIDQAPN